MLLVSVCLITYNHESYLRRAIESILAQEVDFKYEIIIAEDCSQDGTRNICEEYKEKYPDLVKLILQEQNVGLIRNYVSLMNQASGKYIAVCSGDDYWCDTKKLQKQINFLQDNLDYSMCFTNAYEESNFSWEGYKKEIFSNIEDREYKGNEIILEWIIPASSVVFRNKLIDFTFLLNSKFYAEDLVQYLKLNEFGKLRGMSDITTVYTRHENAITGHITSNREVVLEKYVKNLHSIDIELSYKYHKLIKKDLSIVYYKEAIYSYKNVKSIKKTFKYTFLSLLYAPCFFLRQLIRSIYN